MAFHERSFYLLFCVIVLNAILSVKGQTLTGLSIVAGNKQYYIETEQTGNFFEAAHFCAQYDMKLASIANEAEDNRLFSLLKTNGVIDKQYWLGGTSNGITALPYIWIGTGKPATYKTVAFEANKCFLTTAGSTDYTAADCVPSGGEKYNYICEKPLEPDCGKYGQCRFTYSSSSN